MPCARAESEDSDRPVAMILHVILFYLNILIFSNDLGADSIYICIGIHVTMSV